MPKDDSYITVTDVASGGVNTKDDPRELGTNESPQILNMDIARKGRVISRTGYELWGQIGGGATGGFRGVLPFYRTFGSDSGDYFLSFHSNGNAYKSTNATPTPASLGAYGTDSGSVRGVVFDNLAIFGNGLAANSVKKYDGNALANLGGTPQDAKVFGVIGKMLVLSPVTAPQSIYWSDVLDGETWGSGAAGNAGISPKNGGDIRAITQANDQPIILAEFSKHLADISFDTSDVAVRIAFKEKVDISGGCAATGSVQNVVNSQGETVVYLGYHGFQSYGALAEFSDKRSPSEISYKINPTVERVNFNYHDVINSFYLNNKYFCLVPFETSQRNNYAFVMNQEFGSWTIYSGMNFADIGIFRDTDRRDQIIAASNTEAKLFKFNNSFSDNDFGYDRIYQSRTWTFGNRVRWDYIDFEGSKTIGQDIYVDVYIDGAKETQKITDNHLIENAGGGYLADNWLGDAYLGGVDIVNASPLYNWKGRFKTKTKREGQEMYFVIRNNSNGGGFSFRKYGIKIEPLNATVARNALDGASAYLEPIV